MIKTKLILSVHMFAAQMFVSAPSQMGNGMVNEFSLIGWWL